MIFDYEKWILLVIGILAVGFVVYEYFAKMFFPGAMITIHQEDVTYIILGSIGVLMINMLLLINEMRTKTDNLVEQNIKLKSELRESVKEAFITVMPKVNDLERFETPDSAVSYQLRRMKKAMKIWHEAVSPPFVRNDSLIKLFDEAANEVAHKEHVQYYYIANFTDTNRKNRIELIEKDKRIKKDFHYQSLDPGAMASYMMNFMIFDDIEVVLSVPENVNKSTLISIRDKETVMAFHEFFLKQWVEGKATRDRRTW